jgi:hypothetical protein
MDLREQPLLIFNPDNYYIIINIQQSRLVYLSNAPGTLTVDVQPLPRTSGHRSIQTNILYAITSCLWGIKNVSRIVLCTTSKVTGTFSGYHGSTVWQFSPLVSNL